MEEITGREVFKYRKSIKVDELEVDWSLYTSIMRDKQIDNVFRELNTAAAEAIEQQDPNIFMKVAEKHYDLGALNSEPRSQFWYLWYKVYDED